MNSFISKASILYFSSLAVIGFADTSYQTKDLWYLNPTATFFSDSTLGYSYSTDKIKLAGTPTLKSSSVTINEAFSYGITNDFSVGLGLGFANTKQDTLHLFASESTSTASGITDPDLNLQYRILKQDLSALNLDAILDVSPSLGKKKTNNVLRGGTQIQASLNAGKAVAPIEYQIGIDLAYHTNELSSDDTEKARFDFGFHGAFQYDFSEAFSGTAKLLVSFPGKEKFQNTANTLKHDYRVTLDLEPQYQLAKNASVGLGALIAYDTGTIHDGFPGAEADFGNKVWIYGVAADVKVAF